MKSFTEWHNDDEVNEALSISQRRAIGVRMRKLKTKIQRAKAIKQRRMADRDQLSKRARRAARNILTKKLMAGKSKQELTVGQKKAIEDKLKKKSAVITRMSKKLFPKMKKAEVERLKKFRSHPKEETPGEN